jgi:hypothetical protein
MSKKTGPRKKLALSKTTLRHLSTADLRAVAGGRPTLTITDCGEGPCNPDPSTICPDPPPMTWDCPTFNCP